MTRIDTDNYSSQSLLRLFLAKTLRITLFESTGLQLHPFAPKASFQQMSNLHPLLFAPVILSYAKGQGAVCDCSRQALRDTQIMFVSSNLISPLLGELEGGSLRKLRRSVLALCVEMMCNPHHLGLARNKQRNPCLSELSVVKINTGFYW